MNSDDVALARAYAAIYRARGYQPLPASTTEKKPLVRFADYWERAMSDGLFDRFETTNVMLMTGRMPWRLLVIDLDGEEAVRRWAGMGWTPRTWVSHSGGEGRHFWFRLPENYPDPLPLACLWKGEEKHQRIDRLCDHSLVTAPPSYHVRTGKRYRFLSYSESPKELGLPADCPDWVLRLAPVAPVGLPVPTLGPGVVCRYPMRRPVRVSGSDRLDRDEVIRRVNPIAVARSWGVRFTGRVRKDWHECRSVDREDVHPSAAIHREMGVYVDKGSGVSCSLFDLGVLLGVGRDWAEVKDRISEEAIRG